MNRYINAKIAQAVNTALAALDPDTYGHSQRVQRISADIGALIGLDKTELAHLTLGSLLHDVGKQDVPPEILQKPGKLAEDEWEVIRSHPVQGWEFAGAINLHSSVREIILNHHLWYNGQGGYPGQFNGARPSILAQITTVADVLDAMTNDRPYRAALSIEVSLNYLQEKSGSQFGPRVVDCVLENSDRICSILCI